MTRSSLRATTLFSSISSFRICYNAEITVWQDGTESQLECIGDFVIIHISSLLMLIVYPKCWWLVRKWIRSRRINCQLNGIKTIFKRTVMVKWESSCALFMGLLFDILLTVILYFYWYFYRDDDVRERIRYFVVAGICINK